MAEIEPSFLSGYAPAVDDEVRVDALISVFAKAEKACGLRLDEALSVPQCAEAIIRGAKRANLDPGQYQLFWMIRKWAREASAADRISSPGVHPPAVGRFPG